MESSYTVIRENWFTQKPKSSAWAGTLVFIGLLYILNILVFNDLFHLPDLLVATPAQVFHDHQYWRAWSTLFVHGDGGHLMSNSLLLIPLAYLLSAYFGFLIFPLLGIFLGGFINFIVLKNLPDTVSLVGISGVVYWMGATWFGLVLLIDRREKFKRKFAQVLFLTMMLFVPETYRPEVSYLSHFVGFIFGIFTAIIIYLLFRKTFAAKEVKEEIVEHDEENPGLGQSLTSFPF